MNRGDLLERFRLGESAAIASVGRLIRRVVADRGYYIPRDEQDDVVQEAVVQAYRSVCADGFRLAGSFDGYLRTVAHHRCIDWMRQHRASEPVDLETASSAASPEDRLASRERAALGRRVLMLLGDSCRRLIRLRVRDGLSYRDIARRLERSEGGLRNQMYKCVERARAILADLENRRRRAASDED
jgi:RNA polymerase sigma factor (sigma-70 family)